MKRNRQKERANKIAKQKRNALQLLEWAKVQTVLSTRVPIEERVRKYAEGKQDIEAYKRLLSLSNKKTARRRLISK